MRARLLASSLPTLVSVAAAQVQAPPPLPLLTPYAGTAQQPDRGVPFPLPQWQNAAGRRVTTAMNTREGQSNAMTVSWDGGVVMYVDSGDVWTENPPSTIDAGYLFTTFDKGAVDASSGVPDFSECFGTPHQAFAVLGYQVPFDPSGNYPMPAQGYPNLPGSMGELGLLDVEFLSSNLYPAPTAAPGGQNPYPGDFAGNYVAGGAYRVYDAYVTLQDLPKFWDPALGRWRAYGTDTSQTYTEYEAVQPYPNGATGAAITQKRNGICRLLIVVQPGDGGTVKDQVVEVHVKTRWQPFTIAGGDTDFVATTAPTVHVSVPTPSTMWADNFEPNLTHDDARRERLDDRHRADLALQHERRHAANDR